MIAPLAPTRTAWLFVLTLAWGCASSCTGWGQTLNWRSTPQRIRVVIGVAQQATVPTEWNSTLPADLMQQSPVWLPVGWTLPSAISVPDAQLLNWLTENSVIDWSQLPAAWLADVDQLVLMQISAGPAGYFVKSRSVDLATWVATGISESSASGATEINPALVASIRRQLAPVVEIEDVNAERGEVIVRVRGQRLITESGGPGPIAPGDFLQPVVTIPDRQGRYSPAGAREVAWTLLRVAKRRDDGAWQCQMASAYSRPLRTRRSRRVRQIAYRITPTYDQTILELVYRPPLELPRTGCDVYTQPWPVPGQPPGPLMLIGQTDWQGRLTIPPRTTDESTGRGQVLVVKYGQRVVATLPMLVGSNRVARAELPDDRPLVEVESFVRSVEQDLIDLVARRQLIALRVRKLLAEGEKARAEDLVGQLRKMETQSDFLRRIEARQRAISLPSEGLRQKVDKVFGDMRQILARMLTPTFVQQLQDEVNRAKSGDSK